MHGVGVQRLRPFADLTIGHDAPIETLSDANQLHCDCQTVVGLIHSMPHLLIPEPANLEKSVVDKLALDRAE